jgi:predicted nucleotidyltransferase
MFTVEQRDALRERVLGMGEQDERVVAGAVVGSLAFDEGDRYSDVDLTFGVDDHEEVADVLDDWTRTLVDDFEAVPLVDLERGPITYRVFLLPDALQLDLSMSPAADFRPSGPRFRLVFGETARNGPEASDRPVGDLFIATPSVPEDIFGWGVIYGLHARACIERRRTWQAEHYVGAVRDHALALACLREGLPAAQARGYDDLSAETLARSEGSHVGALEPRLLRAALGACVLALMHEGVEARVPHVAVVAERLVDIQVDRAEMPPPD